MPVVKHLVPPRVNDDGVTMEGTEKYYAALYATLRHLPPSPAPCLLHPALGHSTTSFHPCTQVLPDLDDPDVEQVLFLAVGHRRDEGRPAS